MTGKLMPINRSDPEEAMFADSKRIFKTFAAAGLLFVFLAFTACQSSRFDSEGETVLEQNWGRSFETMKYSQTANPEAPESLEPAEGIEGQAAENNMKNYLKGSGGSKANMSSQGTTQ